MGYNINEINNVICNHNSQEITLATNWAKAVAQYFPFGNERTRNIAASKLAENAAYRTLIECGENPEPVSYPVGRPDSGYDLGYPYAVKTSIIFKQYKPSWAMYDNQKGVLILCESDTFSNITRIIRIVEAKDIISLLKPPRNPGRFDGKKLFLYSEDLV